MQFQRARVCVCVCITQKQWERGRQFLITAQFRNSTFLLLRSLSLSLSLSLSRSLSHVHNDRTFHSVPSLPPVSVSAWSRKRKYLSALDSTHTTSPYTPHRRLIGHQGAVYKTVFSPDSQYLLSASEDCTVRMILFVCFTSKYVRKERVASLFFF